MAADLVPIRLSVTAGDLYTLWAPRWRDGGDEWEAFLGKDDDLYGFHSAADLVAFVRGDTDNDLVEHPALGGRHRSVGAPARPGRGSPVRPDRRRGAARREAHRRVGADAAPTRWPSCRRSARCANCPPVTKFFNGNPTLSGVNAGIEEFAGKSGGKRWSNIAAIVGRSWDGVLAAIDEIITTPDVDEDAVRASASRRAGRTGARGAGRRGSRPRCSTTSSTTTDDDDEDVLRRRCGGRGPDGARRRRGLLDQGRHRPGPDDDELGQVLHAALLPRRQPIFLGRNGRISVFPSERALARYLADEHDHDLSELSTYEDIRTAATDGSLRRQASPMRTSTC